MVSVPWNDSDPSSGKREHRGIVDRVDGNDGGLDSPARLRSRRGEVEACTSKLPLAVLSGLGVNFSPAVASAIGDEGLVAIAVMPSL